MKAAIRILLFLGIALALLWTIGSDIKGNYKNTSPPIRVGNMNGVPLEIPVNYMWRGVEYADKSIWEGKKPGDKEPSERTFDDVISAFNLYVKWPDLTPERFDGEGDTSYYNNTEGHPWFLIGIDARYANTPRPPKTSRNGLARVLNWRIKWLERSDHKVYNPRLNLPETVSGMHYEISGKDTVTGLEYAVPTGPSTEKISSANRTLYWQGDRNRSVDVFISCANGFTQNTRIFYRCNHEYIIPEIGAYITVYYTRNWLPQWREIQAATRNLILSFRDHDSNDKDTIYSDTTRGKN